MLPDEIDLRPYARLHSVAVLRDLIRKWWKLELFLVDEGGQPVPGPGAAPEQPRPIAQDNQFCRLSLHAPLGARRCGESLKVALGKLAAARRAERVITHECHLGFDILASALHLSERLCGYVAVSGHFHEPPTVFGEGQLLRKVREVAPGADSGTDLERSLRRVPFLSQGELEQLADLLVLCAGEIQAHHGERALPGRGAEGDEDEALVGTSGAVQALARVLEKLSGSDAPVLIRGEAGSGKELVARALHRKSARRAGPFVVQRCAIFTGAGAEQALAGELLGEGGRRGRLAEAQGGSLLLDEVGALPRGLQERLSALLSGEAPDVRILATTTGALDAGFDPQLLRRLSSLQVEVPPLRERREDLPLLCARLLRKHQPPGVRPVLSQEVVRLFAAYPWPGNVRELEHEVVRLLQLGPQGADLGPELLSPRLLAPAAQEAAP